MNAPFVRSRIDADCANASEAVEIYCERAFVRYALLCKHDLLALFGGVIHRLHHSCGDNCLVDVRRKLFAGLDATDEGVDLVLEHCVSLELGLELDKSVARGGIQGEIAAVGKTDTCFGTDEVDIGFGDADVLCPCAVEGDGGAFGANEAGNEVVNVINAVEVLGVFRPHAVVNVVGHIYAELGECLCGNGERLGVVGAVHNDIEVMYAPVDKNAAACDGFVGKCAAEAGDGAVSAEAYVYVINFAEFARLDKLANLINCSIETVNNADVEDLAGFVLCFLQELRKEFLQRAFRKERFCLP